MTKEAPDSRGFERLRVLAKPLRRAGATRVARQASFAFEIFTSNFSVISAFLRTDFSVV